MGPDEQAGVKKNYRIAQFHATMHCIIGDATAAFVPLLGIQAAPFLMTLVRKGLVTSYTYHRVYAAALYVPYAVATLRLVQGTFGVYKVLWFGNVTMLLVSGYLGLKGLVGMPFSTACLVSRAGVVWCSLCIFVCARVRALVCACGWVGARPPVPA